MKFELAQCLEILERTPKVLEVQLSGLSKDWLRGNEGNESWSPYEVVGHLIHGEKTDWMVRIKSILDMPEKEVFEPFDRFAHQKENQNLPIATLLKRFASLRANNLKQLSAFSISEDNLKLEGVHPEFGRVTLAQLIAAWVVHDLGHIAQISRVMAKQYCKEVGPWVQYMPILNQ